MLEGRLDPDQEMLVDLPELEPLLRQELPQRIVVAAGAGLDEDARAFARELQAVGLRVTVVGLGEPIEREVESERALVVVIGARRPPASVDAPILMIGDEPGRADARLRIESWAGPTTAPVRTIARRLVLRMVAIWIAVRTTRHPDELRGFVAETVALPHLLERWLEGRADGVLDVAPHLEPFKSAVEGLRGSRGPTRLEPSIAM